jgi:hypothetical protein
MSGDQDFSTMVEAFKKGQKESKEGVETLFEETTKVAKEPKYGKLDYDRIAKQEGVDVEEIRGKTVKEIIEYLAAVRDKADGGRIGYDVGGLTGQAKNIYDSWIAAGHSSEAALDYLTSRGLYGPGSEGIESIVNTQQSIIPQGGGGGGNYTGLGGKWGNLDLSKSKTFNKGVYEVGGPGNMYGSYVDKEIEGFYNPTLGNWQTFDGKNINHAGWFTGDPEEGDIEGTPIDWAGIPMGAWGLGMKVFKGVKDKFTDWRANQNRIAKENLQKQIEAENLREWMEAQQAQATSAADLQNIKNIQKHTGQGLSGYRMSRPASERQFTGHGKSGMGRDKSELMASGGRAGLATMFTRRR